MQKKIYLSLLLGVLLLASCNKQTVSKQQLPDKISIQISIKDTALIDTLRLYIWNAIQVEEVAKVAVQKTDGVQNAQFDLNKINNGMYYIGQSLSDLKPLLLGTEASIKLEGNARQIAAWKVIDSDLNKEYAKLLVKMQEQNQYFMSLLNQYSENKGNEAELLKIRKKMAIEDTNKKKLLDSLVEKNSELARIVAFNTFQSYQNNGKAGEVEATYFANSFFQFVDLEDTVYTHLPFFYENIKNYTMALSQMGLKAPAQQVFLDSLVAKVPSTNKNYKATLVGCMLGAMGRNNPMFLRYSALYTAQFAGDYPMLDKFVKEQTIKLRGVAGIGTLAPELAAPSPDGSIKSLSQLRGKYVLIDFWASWCGPCRRENPNVVRLYNQYKDKGFEILGVSLDNSKSRWIDAIAKDKLTWPHISDLKGWSSHLSKQYGVRGIPYTVLVDKEGRIIAKQLRGASLEKKLQEIFGK